MDHFKQTVRQGDVLLKRIKTIPKTAKKQETKDRIVLAYGEVTGHAHAIHDLDNVDVFVTEVGVLYLKVFQDVMLHHDEHSAVTLTEGIYERVLQHEYSPEAVRNVAD